MAQTFEQIAAIWKKLGVNQKATLIFLLVAFIGGIAALVHLSRRPSYELLYADMSEKDVAQVVSFLKESEVPFRVAGGGTSVLVAEGQKYDMRMALAEKGIQPGSGDGLELFDGGGFVTTQLAEQMLKRRAIQGELARTIMRLDQVEWANVQIAQPEKSVFAEDQQPATASIALQIAPARSLSPGQVAGICQLVAGSVEGLDPENVRIIDTRGNILSAPGGDGPGTEARDFQGYRQAYEDYLAGKAQALLNRALGPERSVVKVSAVIDMDRRSETERTFGDKDQVTLREKTSTTSSTGGEGGSTEETIDATYDYPSKSTTLETAPGRVKRLDVALIVDPYYTDAEGNEAELTPQEITDLEDLVKGAVGFDAARGDTCKSSRMRFHRVVEETYDDEIKEQHSKEFILEIAKYSSSVLAVIVFVIFAGVVLKRISRSTAASSQSAAASMPEFMMTAGTASLESGNGLSKVRNRVRDIMSGDPAAAARLLQRWINQSGGPQQGGSN